MAGVGALPATPWAAQPGRALWRFGIGSDTIKAYGRSSDHPNCQAPGEAQPSGPGRPGWHIARDALRLRKRPSRPDDEGARADHPRVGPIARSNAPRPASWARPDVPGG